MNLHLPRRFFFTRTYGHPAPYGLDASGKKQPTSSISCVDRYRNTIGVDDHEGEEEEDGNEDDDNTEDADDDDITRSQNTAK